MRRLALIGLSLGLALPAVCAEEKATFEGHELVVVSVARMKAFRDLKVKDAKTQDLAVVTVELRWRGDKRHVLIKEDDLSVRDTRGKSYDCALSFVQADAAEETGPARFEIPFQVRADVALVSLRVGKAVLAIDSPSSNL